MSDIPIPYHDLLADSTPALLYLATLMPNGSPQVTPVWFSMDGEDILVNSIPQRVKHRNMVERPQVACLIADPADAGRYIHVRGRVVEVTEQGADEHVLDLALKYNGRREFDFSGQTRVMYRIRPESVSVHG